MLQRKDETNKEQFDFDDKTKSAVAQLWDERVNGRFKSDRDGFTKAFLNIQENATFDPTKKLSGSQLFNGGYNANPDTVIS